MTRFDYYLETSVHTIFDTYLQTYVSLQDNKRITFFELFGDLRSYPATSYLRLLDLFFTSLVTLFTVKKQSFFANVMPKK